MYLRVQTNNPRFTVAVAITVLLFYTLPKCMYTPATRADSRILVMAVSSRDPLVLSLILIGFRRANLVCPGVFFPGVSFRVEEAPSGVFFF